jgi:hypothetical protein
MSAENACKNTFIDKTKHKYVVMKRVIVRGYSILLYVIKFISDLQQVGGFLLILRFPPPMKLTATI